MSKTHKSSSDRSSSSTPSTGAGKRQESIQALLQRAEIAPGSLRAGQVLQLQRTVGNRATGQLLQAKLKLGPVGDVYEQEADRVAAQVVHASRQPDVQREDMDEEMMQAKPLAGGIGPVQREDMDEEMMQAKPLAEGISRVQRAFVAPPPNFGKVQREEMEDELQASPNHGLEGGDVDTDVARSIESARGGGQPLHDGVRSSMESAFGADFSGVNVHTGSQSDALNRSLNARAFTTGSDIFFGKGQYNPGSSGGQELIAHELTHTVQQGAAGLHRQAGEDQSSPSSPNLTDSPQNLVQPDNLDTDDIQREFRPASVVSNAHLRNRDQWSTYVGNKIKPDDEIVVDRDQTEIEPKRYRFGNNTTWVKAVNVPGSRWNPNVHGGANTYIRDGHIGADKQYPHRAEVLDHKPPLRKNGFGYRFNWNPNIGEYVVIEESVTHPGAFIVKYNNSYWRLSNAGQIEDLDVHEQLQLSTSALKDYLKGRILGILRTANQGNPWRDLLATSENAEKLMSDTEGSKALRFDTGSGYTRETYVAWYRWATADDGPFHRIQEGAEYVRDALTYWRGQLFPQDADQVQITSIKMSGSDLHESGLGVMFVKFTKPIGGHPDYDAAGEHEVVIKPEARMLEKALFGTQNESLANQINAAVGLAPNDQITTYKQDVNANYGTLCEKVAATQADKLGAPANVISQAMKEALVFILITGLTDQHGENVLWDDQGKPYMIDADNALKLAYMQTDMPIQNGFKFYAGAQSDPTIRGVMSSAVNYETRIMQELRNPTSLASQRLLLKVREIFAAQTGRTVPIETAVWGIRLQMFIMCPNEGTDQDQLPQQGVEPTTRWQWCKYWATTVPEGKGAFAPGLQGEVGMAGNGNGNFQQDEEARQLYADFKVGQIPFYNYRYGDGKVLHNTRPIWDGQPIAERMAVLFQEFPNQAQN